MKPNELTGQIIGAAIEVHRELGPGKPEMAYEAALAQELLLRGLPHRRQKAVPIVYKGMHLQCGYRIDVLVNNTVVVEVKAVETIAPVHRAQTLTYLKIGGWKFALLLNFNVAILKEGIVRFVLGAEEEGRTVAPAQSRQATVGCSEIAAKGLRHAADSSDTRAEQLAQEVISSSMEVHRTFGPGLLPSAYEACLCHELHLRGIPFEAKRRLPLRYKGVALPETDEVALLVGGSIVVVPCALPELQRVHEAQLLSQLRLGGWKLGLLVNFNTMLLGEGIRRVVFSGKAR